jgi:hypothetical protein
VLARFGHQDRYCHHHGHWSCLWETQLRLYRGPEASEPSRLRHHGQTGCRGISSVDVGGAGEGKENAKWSRWWHIIAVCHTIITLFLVIHVLVTWLVHGSVLMPFVFLSFLLISVFPTDFSYGFLSFLRISMFRTECSICFLCSPYVWSIVSLRFFACLFVSYRKEGGRHVPMFSGTAASAC